MGLFSCEKGDIPEVRNSPSDELRIDLQSFSKAVAKSVQDENVRKFIYEEVGKMFDSDYDLPYAIVKDKKVVLENGNVMSFENVLLEHIDTRNFDQLLLKIPNLSISFTRNFEKWNYLIDIPLVAPFKKDIVNDDMNNVFGYNYKGSKVKLENDYDSKVFLLAIKDNERVDKEGRIRVNSQGLVIPSNHRQISAVMAYDKAKVISFNQAKATQLIEIRDNDFFVPSGDDGDWPPYTPPSPPDNPPPPSAAAGSNPPDAPKMNSVEPRNSNSLHIDWTGVPNVKYYALYREENFSGTSKILALLETHPNFDVTSYSDKNLNLGDRYSYSVRAFEDEFNYSQASDVLYGTGSWRKDRGKEVIERIYVSKKAWKNNVGIFDGKIEIQFQLILYDTKNNRIEMSEEALGKVKRKNQKGEWYNYQEKLFDWDIDRFALNYSIFFWEDDTDASNDEITLSVTSELTSKLDETNSQKTTSNVSFKIAKHDDKFGRVDVNHYDANHLEYKLKPEKGGDVTIMITQY